MCEGGQTTRDAVASVPPDGVATLLLHPVNCPAASLCDACCSLPQLRDILLFHITSPAAIDRPVLLADLVRMRS